MPGGACIKPRESIDWTNEDRDCFKQERPKIRDVLGMIGNLR